MNKPRVKKIEFGEYTVVIKYYGDGHISVDIFDELGEIIEGMHITNESDGDKIDFNLN